MPEFPGGLSACMSYLARNVKYPTIAMENGIQGRVLVQFCVEKDGSISNTVVTQSVDSSLDKEASGSILHAQVDTRQAERQTS